MGPGLQIGPLCRPDDWRAGDAGEQHQGHRHRDLHPRWYQASVCGREPRPERATDDGAYPRRRDGRRRTAGLYLRDQGQCRRERDDFGGHHRSHQGRKYRRVRRLAQDASEHWQGIRERALEELSRRRDSRANSDEAITGRATVVAIPAYRKVISFAAPLTTKQRSLFDAISAGNSTNPALRGSYPLVVPVITSPSANTTRILRPGRGRSNT